MKMSRVETGMRVALQYYEAFNGRDAAAMMQLMSDNCLLETSEPAPDGLVISGQEAVTRYWEAFFDEQPEVQIEIEEIFGLGMRCVARWHCEWVDADGKRKNVRGVDILRVRAGLISEVLAYRKG